MKKTRTPKSEFEKKVIAFFSTTWGMVVLFIVIFYAMTFLVYYFYSPGPEERRMAELEKNLPPPIVSAAQLQSSIQVENDLLKGTQQDKK